MKIIIDKKLVFYALKYTVLILALSLISWTGIRYIFNNRNTYQSESNEKTTWMTVFIHGSFGSLMSFLSLSDVLQDKISGTLYQATAKKMRADDVFFKDQPLLQRGLVAITPSFDLSTTNNKKYVAYPIAAAYQMITDAIRPGSEENIFYTFGWSGLISQSSRRFEAVRLYNALYKELENLRSRGLNPKVRIITHSHGGNLSLNLAAINMVLNQSSWTNDTAKSNNNVSSDQSDQKEALQKMATVLGKLTTQEDAAQHTGQKALDYVPIGRNLIIDELILFGVPIQPETEPFCFSDTFKCVYNFYSYEDLVQKLDWVTSKQPLSNQRIRDLRPRTKKGRSPVIQAQLMIDRNEQELKPVSLLKREPTVIDEVSEGRNIFVRTSKDPTHKELWFLSWQNDEKNTLHQSSSILMPLPIMILTPLLQRALKRIHGKDVRLNIRQAEDVITIDVIGQHQRKNVVNLQRSLIDEIIRKTMPWRPENTTPEKELDTILKHLS